MAVNGVRINSTLGVSIILLDDESAGRVLKAAVTYASTGQITDCGERGNLVFDAIRADIDTDKARAEKRAEVNRENGRKGGRPKKASPVMPPEPIPETMPEPMPELIPETIPETIPEPIPEDLPEPKEKKPRKKTAKSYSEGFEEIWKGYPRKENKAESYREYTRRVADGYSPEELKKAVQRYVEDCRQKHTPVEYTRKMRTFFSVGGSFEDYIRKEEPAGETYTEDLASLLGGE